MSLINDRTLMLIGEHDLSLINDRTLIFIDENYFCHLLKKELRWSLVSNTFSVINDITLIVISDRDLSVIIE